MPPEAPPGGERALQERWAAAHVPGCLRTEAGESLRLLYAGHWNAGPGPDFRAARLLAGDGRPIVGDVELHLTPREWRRHGHQSDPAYAQVLLHVVGGMDPGPDVETSVPRLLVLPAGPRDPTPSSLPCEHVVAAAAERAVSAGLTKIAIARLRRKATRLRRSTAPGGPDGVAYGALLEALGQGGNRDGMRLLAARLPWPLLAARGLDASALAMQLRQSADRLEAEGEIHWRRAGVRPVNQPHSRLGAAAQLLDRFRTGPCAGLAAQARRPERAALESLRVAKLLGRERSRQLLVDVCYPLALAFGDHRGRAADGELLARRWLRLAPTRYARTDALRSRLIESGLRDWRNGTSQALLDLERDYCAAGACAVCPLARLARRGPSRGPLRSTNREPSAPLGPSGRESLSLAPSR